MLPELGDTTECETSKKEGPVGERTLSSGIAVCVVEWARVRPRRPHWGYSDGWLTAWRWLGPHWAVHTQSCSQFSSWSAIVVWGPQL